MTTIVPPASPAFVDRRQFGGPDANVNRERRQFSNSYDILKTNVPDNLVAVDGIEMVNMRTDVARRMRAAEFRDLQSIELCHRKFRIWRFANVDFSLREL